ncbi:MAG: bifunctional DNA primase/polymerase [Egibacteraceae bacterium]
MSEHTTGGYRLLVFGAREWTDEPAIRQTLRKAQAQGVGTVVHGGCRGADRIAGTVAEQLGLTVEVFPADWARHGKAAGHIRNQRMLDDGNPDYAIGFHTNLDASRGSADMLARCNTAGLPVHVETGTRASILPDAAELYARAGWPVLPLHDVAWGVCSCKLHRDCRHEGRHPRTEHGFHDATTDLRQVKSWWGMYPFANIGIATGGTSRLSVVDLDGRPGRHSWQQLAREHGAGPGTATVSTPHGSHRWYRTPTGINVPRRIGALGQGVDLLGDDGYAIAPPSQVPCLRPHEHDGPHRSEYRWSAPKTRLASLPEWIIHASRHHDPLQRQPQATPEPVQQAMRGNVRRSYGQAALDGEAARMAGATKGTRYHTLGGSSYRLGQLIGAGELIEEQARKELWQAAEACGYIEEHGEATVRKEIDSGLEAGALNPRSRQPREGRREMSARDGQDNGSARGLTI